MMTRKFAAGDGVATGFLLLLNALYFLPVLSEGNGAVLSAPGTDIWHQFFYWRTFAYENLVKGELPLWNPYIFSGTPFVAGMQSAVFYPLNFIFFLFEVPFAINLSVALHCFLASLFTYCYARHVGISRSGAAISGIVFAYGAPYFLHIFAGHLAPLCTMAWLPLIFLGVDQFLEKKRLRYAAWSGVAVAAQILAGHFQYAFYSLIALSIYFFIRIVTERAKQTIPFLIVGFSIVIFIGFLLSAVQLLPAGEFARYSAREGVTYDWISQFSLPPEGLLTLVMPNFFGDNLGTPYWGKNLLWEVSIYLGAVPFLLAIVGVAFRGHAGARFLALVALAALILALGKYTPLLLFLYNYVPGFGQFRGLAKFIFVFSFATAILAGGGSDKVGELAGTAKRKLAYLALGVLGISLLSILLSMGTPLFEKNRWATMVAAYVTSEDWYYQPPALTDDFIHSSMSTALQSSLRTCFLWALLAVLLWGWSKAKNGSGRFLSAALVGLTAVDLWLFGAPYLVSFDPQHRRMDGALKAFLSRDRDPFRVATAVDPLVNMGMVEGIENVGGYDPLMVKRYGEFINLAEGRPVGQRIIFARVKRTSPLLDLLNVRYYLLPAATDFAPPNSELAFENSNYRVYRNERAFPRSFIVHAASVIKDADEVLRRIASPAFNPFAAAIVEEPVESLPADARIQSPPPKFLERSLNRVVLQASLNGAGLLVLADVFYPGWSCYVDGKETKIYRANYIMRGVVVPGGSHLVEFRYEPLSFKIGVAISMATLVLVIGWLVWDGRRGFWRLI